MSLISVSRKSGLEFEVQVGPRTFTSDLSEEDGGGGLGPSPSELLVGSLAVCIAIMAQRYCDRHCYTDGEVTASATYELADDPKRIASKFLYIIPNRFSIYFRYFHGF